MELKNFESLKEKAVEAQANEGSTEGIKVYFKSKKRRKLITQSQREINKFYHSLKEIEDELAMDAETLDSEIFKVSAKEAISQKYGASEDKIAKEAAEGLNLWSIHTELGCQRILMEAFPDKILKNKDMKQDFSILSKKVNNLIIKTRRHMNQKNMPRVFNNILFNSENKINEFKLLVDLFKE